MAVLPDEDRRGVWAAIMADLSDDHEPCGIVKDDLRAAIDAVDAWAESNAASYNAALPQPTRTVLTAQQKARILMAVLRRRFEVT